MPARPSKASARAAKVKVPVVRLPHGRGLALPGYQTAGAAGMDLVAAVAEGEPVLLAPMHRALIPTGLKIALPKGYEAQVRPRSGLAVKHGVTVLNSPGTIDCDYRGEVMVLLINLGEQQFAVVRGERIAQMVVQPVVRAELSETASLEDTARGAGGFGSTGTTAGQPAAKGGGNSLGRRGSTGPARAKNSPTKTGRANAGKG